MRSIIKYFQQILLFLPLCFLLFQVSAINHQVLSEGPTGIVEGAEIVLALVRSIIKYFQQVLRQQEGRCSPCSNSAINHQVLSAGPTCHSFPFSQYNTEGAINHQVLSAGPTKGEQEIVPTSVVCDQSSSTFSRSYSIISEKFTENQ